LCQSTPSREVSKSTSLLYHAFGIRGYDSVRTGYRDGQVIFSIALGVGMGHYWRNPAPTRHLQHNLLDRL
jgi:hypothetical protein